MMDGGGDGRTRADIAELAEALPSAIQYVHFGALAAILLCVMLLIAPATAHRLAFNGQDSVQFYKVGSALVTAALFPLAIGIAGDFMWRSRLWWMA